MNRHYRSEDDTPAEVSTDAQRQALDAMSEQLVRKLHDMVAEQERRARDFAAHQHSLSAQPSEIELPTYEIPEQHRADTPAPQPALPPKPPIPPALRRAVVTGPKPDTTPHHSFPAPMQHPATPQPQQREFGWDAGSSEDEEPEVPEEKKATIGAGTIIFFVIFAIIILRSCG